jgi:hypothetical protein
LQPLKIKIMKRFTKPRTSLFPLMGVLFLVPFMLLSCEKNDFFYEDGSRKSSMNCHIAMVSDIEIPVKILTGQPADFKVTYVKPNPCYDFQGIRLESQGRLIQLTVCLGVPKTPCIDVLDGGQEVFSITFHQTGFYQIRYKDYEGEKTVSFQVERGY